MTEDDPSRNIPSLDDFFYQGIIYISKAQRQPSDVNYTNMQKQNVELHSKLWFNQYKNSVAIQISFLIKIKKN